MVEKLRLIGIDPGTTKSSIITVEILNNNITIVYHNELLNEHIRIRLKETINNSDIRRVIIEDVKSQGMAVGETTFETVKWIGRFIEIVINEENPTNTEVICIPRYKVKHLLCGSTRAKDPHIRQRLIDIYGYQGTKKNPGPLFGITSHKLQALAVITAYMIENKIDPIFSRSLQ